MNPDDITYKIVTEAQETQDEFIFTTILPFCEEVTQKKLNKRELEQILLAGMKALEEKKNDDR